MTRVTALWLRLICALFVASCPAAQAESLRQWNDYRTIMWVGDTAYKKPEKLGLFYQRLREMGINTAMVHGDGDIKPLLQNAFPYYVENMVSPGLCLKFSSKVTDWDKFVTEWANHGRPNSALIRDYCLEDPQWQNRARKQIQGIVSKNREHNPLAYNIRDELSITISANPFDYDFNPLTLAAFRQWLKGQYPDLAALNREWETKFSSWDEIKPFTTDEIKNRMGSGDALPAGKPDWQQVQALKFDSVPAMGQPTRWNFSPWADFRSYMDLSLARVLDELRRAAHEVDPRTPVGIEGTQMPDAFGGYDLWRLSQVIDWAEPYDIGNAREIFASFMPKKPLMTTVFEADTDHARRRLWHLLLEGDHGCIVWWSEDCIDWKTEDYQLTPKAKALGPVLKELTSPLAQLFLRAEPEYDPIYLHYSQSSIQVDWLLESTVDGSTWLRRFSSYEAEHNHMAKVRNGWLKAFQDLGYSPRFISSEQIASGGLPKTGAAALVLPTSWALSQEEIAAIKHFLDPGEPGKTERAIFSDVTPGLFDEHARLRKENPLGKLFPAASTTQARAARSGVEAPASMMGDIANYPAQRPVNVSGAYWPAWIAEQMQFARPEISIASSACIRTHRYRVGSNLLVAFERNVDYHMSEELKPAGGNERLEKSIEVEAKLARPMHVYDLRSQKYLGLTKKLQFTIDPWQPSLFALTKAKLPSDSLLEELARAPISEK